MKMAVTYRYVAISVWMLAIFLGTPAAAAEQRTLQPFETEAAFRKVVQDWYAEAEKRWGAEGGGIAQEVPVPDGTTSTLPSLPSSPDSGSASSDVLDTSVAVTGSRIKATGDESITNVQTEGVDEGDIVKRQGDFLIVLRRGRLFTIRIGGDNLEAVSVANAYGDGVDPEGAWYDEMLVSDNTVVVIGYSYRREGTEIILFDLSDAGVISYRAMYHLRSADYYSSRNYVSRLTDGKLVIYTQLHLYSYEDFDGNLPALRHWDTAGGDAAKFERILPATRIYRTPREIEIGDDFAPVLHAINVCDLSRRDLTCLATAVLGASGGVFYVSEDSIFVWTASSYWDERNNVNVAKPADVFRIPLDGSAPTAIQASGVPIDQMSFLQKDGYLNVLLREEAKGQWMFASESVPGDISLLRVPLELFADGSDVAEPRHYRRLRGINGEDTDIHNRFIGDWLVVGAEEIPSDRRRSQYPVQVIRYASLGNFRKLRVGHIIERIEAIGDDAILVGSLGDDLRFTSIALSDRPTPVSVYTQRGAEQGDDRSHGFFYRATGDDEGLLGLPVITENNYRDEAASVLFLRNVSLRLRKAGDLSAQLGTGIDDGCKASCIDWYGDARPIFVDQRIFALLGYELVEGVFDGQSIRERRRVDFAPKLPIVH